MQVVMKLTPSVEQTQNWDKRKFFDALGRSSDKPRMEYCEDHNKKITLSRAVQGPSHGVTINPTSFSLTKIPLSWKGHTVQTDSSANSKSILEIGLWEVG